MGCVRPDEQARLRGAGSGRQKARPALSWCNLFASYVYTGHLVWYSALNPNNVFDEIVADTKRLGGDNAYEIDIGV